MDDWEDATIIETGTQEDDDDWSSAQVVEPTNVAASSDDWSDAIVVDDQPDEEKLTTNQIVSNPAKMSQIRAYMIDRKGVEWNKKTDQETWDAYTTHMREVNTNELRTLGEAKYIQSADDKKKANAALAYSVYEELKPFWSCCEGLEAVKDYGVAILTSPSTWIGFGIGSVASKGASKLGARALIMSAARDAMRTGGKDAAKKVLASAAVKDSMLRIGAATGTDVVAGISQDYMYQDIMQDVGLQKDYNYLQTAIMGATGVIGGGVAAIPLLRKGAGVGFNNDILRTSIKTRQTNSVSNAVPRIKQSISKLKDQLVKLKSGSINWQEAVEAGSKSNPTINDVSDNVSWFFNPEDPDSLFRIVVDSGAKLDLSEGVRFTDQIMGFVNKIPSKEYDEINSIIEPVTGLKLGQMLEQVALGESRSGTMLNSASRAKQYARDFAHISAVNNATNSMIIKASETPPVSDANVKNPEYVRYMASLWRRALVSHPATTAVNVQGWGIASTARSLAEVLHGGMVGTAGVVGNIVGAKWAPKALQQSKALMASQVYKLNNLLDPFASREAFNSLIRLAPKKVQDRTFREAFGGIGQETTPEMFGVGSNKAVRAAENYSDVAAKLSMIKLQDVYTKTFSGMTELDKQVRLKFNKGLGDLISDGEYYKIDEDMWNKTVDTLLQDSFSFDYTKGHRPFYLDQLADQVEKFSNTPYLGFIAPFGRFMNNNLAFTMQYSPLAAVPLGARMVKTLRKEGVGGAITNTELMEGTAKAMVGSMALGYMVDYSREAQKDGYQWFEVEESSGSVTSEQNLAPIAMFRLLGRIGDHWLKGESISPDLQTEFVNQLGIWQWTKEASGDNPLTNFAAYLQREDNPEYKEQAWELAASAFASIGSGFTRPFDPLNQMVGMATDSDAAVDRRLADPGVQAAYQEITRYTDNIFEALLSTTIGEPKSAATRPEGDIKNPNAIAGLVGRKEVPAKNYTDKLMGMVDKPAYLVDQRSGIPEADAFMNKQVGPLLNALSKKILDDPNFQKATPAIKRARVDAMIGQARKIVRGWLNTGEVGTNEDRVADMRRTFIVQPQAYRDEARKAFNITTPDRDLSEDEILLMKDYIGLIKGLYGDSIN